MCYSCAMMSPKDTSPEEEGTNADGAEWDGAEWEEGAAEFDCCNQNWALLFVAHMTVKWLEERKGTEKWRKILVIAEGKMSLSRDTESR